MLDWLWPIACAGCGREGAGRVCAACAGDGLRALVTPPEGIAAAWCLGPYDGPLGAVVRRAKFRPDRHAALALGALLAARSTHLPFVDAVVPAPSTRASRARRGFATAAILARAVAQARGMAPLHALWLAPGARQSASSLRQRKANLEGRVHGVRTRTPLSGTVLLVDDVVTTGATAEACARELLCEGARSILLLTVAATPLVNRRNPMTTSDMPGGSAVRLLSA